MDIINRLHNNYALTRKLEIAAIFLSLLLVIMTLIWAYPAEAASITINDEDGARLSGGFTSRIFQGIILMTIISISPAILMMVTSFTKIIIVFSILRNATGLQQTPPNNVMAGLALFLTFFIMSPTFEKSYTDGYVPLSEGKISEEIAIEKIVHPFKSFMLSQIEDKDLQIFADLAKVKLGKKEDTPLRIIIPSFMVSELHKGFQIGFLLFLPFLIIDLVVSAILMVMGMMMMPPAMISLPFKLIFFVLVDGWYLLCSSLAKSYGIG